MADLGGWHAAEGSKGDLEASKINRSLWWLTIYERYNWKEDVTLNIA